MSVGKIGPGSYQLAINRDWDGVLLPRSQRGTVRLTRRANDIVVDLESGYARNPSPEGPAGHTPGLWHFEAIEVFIAPSESTERYLELEFGPFGHHLVLTFDGDRSPGPEQEAVDVRSSLGFKSQTDDGDRWAGRASLRLPAFLCGTNWRANAFRVWSEKHRRFAVASDLPGATPDFHQPAHFPILQCDT